MNTDNTNSFANDEKQPLNVQPYGYGYSAGGSTLISIEGDASVAEGGKASYTVSLSEAAVVDVVVDIIYTLKDVDKGEIIEKTKSVRIGMGEVSKSFTVENVDDTLIEGDEVYNVGIEGIVYVIGEEVVSFDVIQELYPEQKMVEVNPTKQNVDTVIIDDELLIQFPYLKLPMLM